MKIAGLFGIMMFIAAIGQAQLLTLNEYRQRVLAYNQDIKQSQEAVKAALYSLKSVRTGYFPRVDVTGDYSWQFEKVEFMEGVSMKHDNYGVEVGALQNVYAGSAVRLQYESAKVRQAIARLGEEYTVENILYAADLNYWTVVANRELYEVAEEFVRIVGELFEIVNKRFVEGAISKTDVLMVQTRLKEAELQLNTAVMNYQTSVHTLNVMMGKAAEAPTILADSMRAEPELPVRQSLDVALTNRADYQMTLREVELARLQTRLVKADYLPHLAIGVREKWGTTLINVDGDKRFSTVAFANLSIPIFYWGERRQNVRISRTEEQNRELERSKVADQIRLDLNNAWVNLIENRRKIEIVNSSLEIARNNLILNTFSYNEGKLPILDVLSAQVTWLQAYTNVITVHYQYQVALADYVKALGEV